MLFKIVLNHEIHVTNFKPHQDYQDLINFLQKVFKKLPATYHLEYEDEEGDKIQLLGDEDLSNLMSLDIHKVYVTIKSDQAQQNSIMQSSKSAFVERQQNGDNEFQEKREIKNEGSTKDEIVHYGIICDQCFAQPIVGMRYKCSVCDDYDICQKCQPKSLHEHAMIKIKYAQQQFEKETINPIFSIFDTVGNSMKSKVTSIKNFTSTVKDKMFAAKEPQNNDTPKKQNKKQQSNGDIFNLPVKKEQQKISDSFDSTDRHVQVASYLSDILGLGFNHCYNLSLKNPDLNKQQLLVKVLNNEKDN